MATRATGTMLMMLALLTTKRAVATKTMMMPLSSIAPWEAGAPDLEVNRLTLEPRKPAGPEQICALHAASGASLRAQHEACSSEP